jgi:bleomycin hydrolase
MDMKNAKEISQDLIERFYRKYDEDPMAPVLTAAAYKTELAELVVNPAEASKLSNVFNVEVKTSAVTAQKQSGRCWLFATMNLLREEVAKNTNQERVTLSGNFIAFWDKIEKYNYFLETIIDTAHLPLTDRTVHWALSGVSDGGQWDMVVGLIEKYGIVPESVMPETANSTNTRLLNRIFNTTLHKDAAELRHLVEQGVDPTARKEEMLAELFKALGIVFGRPTQTFDYEYVDKNNVYHMDHGLTPLDFYKKYVKINLSDFVSIINSPTKDKPYGKSYTVKYLGNVVGKKVRYLNLPIAELKELAIRQLKEGEPVWFGSDCGKYGHRNQGIWDPASFVYGEFLGGLDQTMSKEERLDYLESAMNHAMLLTGVNIDESGTPNRWKIENSWGEDVGYKGYYIASDTWFEDFTYQVIINKKYLSAEQLEAYNQPPILLQPWDPMGTLA